MFDTKVSGKFSLEYLIYIFRCLQLHGSIGDSLKFSQNDTQRLEVEYDPDRTGRFKIKVVNRLSAIELNELTASHSLDEIKNSNEEPFKHVLCADNARVVANSLILGSNTLFNVEEAFELDFESARDVFFKTSSEAQIIHPPVLSSILILIWGGYEFFRYVWVTDKFSFNVSFVDTIELGLFLVNAWVFWAHKMNKQHIPVFREGTCPKFELHKSLTKSLITSMFFLAILSSFTS